MTLRPWPVLRSYDVEHLGRISLPVGGVGTGTIGFGGRGDLRDFQIGDRPGVGFRPGSAFFALRVATEGSPPTAAVLEGPLSDWDYEGQMGATASNHGLPRFRSARFEAAYPFGQVMLEDDRLPTVVVRAYNPLIPSDLDASSLPIFSYTVTVANTTESPMTVSVAGCLENFVGTNGSPDDTRDDGNNANLERRTDELHGFVMTAPNLIAEHVANGQFALAVLSEETETTTVRTGWRDASWGNSLLDFWDDLLDDGDLDSRTSEAPRPIGSVCSRALLAAGETHTFRFLMGWSFPNRRGWKDEPHEPFTSDTYTGVDVGNFYAGQYPEAWNALEVIAPRLDALEEATIAAVGAIVASSTPLSIREAALFNLSTLRSQTVFRARDGRFYGWEGVMDHAGSCFGNCTHVWGYEFASSSLFPQIAWSFRETQFLLATDERGFQPFRVGLPVERTAVWHLAAADGQMATLVHLYYDYILSGDRAALRRVWPAARRALEFAWIPGGWDADQDGVMEGCQHNTMDVEYYGPNPQMGTWYLAALKAMSELAREVGEDDFAARCAELFAAGSGWLDDYLFTGTHYQHLIVPTPDDSFVAAGLRHVEPAVLPHVPDLQLGSGVLIDQLVGQYASRLVGLGPLLDDGHVRTTLQTIFTRNVIRDLHSHFNHLRGFAVGDESGVVMASYAPDDRPERPFPYFNEVMTGFEYTFATGLIQEGMAAEGAEVIENIRDRYTGRRRNPFDETECGHHYARAMASWSAFMAWNDFHYDARAARIAFTLRDDVGQTFWSTGMAWGTWRVNRDENGATGTLTIEAGVVRLDVVRVAGVDHPLRNAEHDGRRTTWRVAVGGDE